jgi:outer membrane protein TolC
MSLQYAISRMNILKKSVDAATENYFLQKKDYEFNIVSNLEVLTAIQNLQDAKRSLIQATSEAKRLYWQLRVASGQTVKDDTK